MATTQKEYQSSIPEAAIEHVTESYPDGRKKRAEYLVGTDVVGIRSFFESGDPELEYALRGGKKHGTEYTWHAPGELLSAEPYLDGLEHGTAKQWSHAGELLGIYSMVHGTGIDLWRAQREDGSAYLAEVFYMKDGALDGFEWRVSEDQQTVFIERHWRGGRRHGIERQWTGADLDAGYPKYYVDDNEVDKQQYAKACEVDQSLPPHREEDDRPDRSFPPEITRELSVRK